MEATNINQLLHSPWIGLCNHGEATMASIRSCTKANLKLQLLSSNLNQQPFGCCMNTTEPLVPCKFCRSIDNTIPYFKIMRIDFELKA